LKSWKSWNVKLKKNADEEKRKNKEGERKKNGNDRKRWKINRGNLRFQRRPLQEEDVVSEAVSCIDLTSFTLHQD
jgi:hypothetical protein